MRFVVEMIAYLTQIRDEGDSDTIPRSLLDCLLQATVPIIANQSQHMVGMSKKSALSRVALASEYLGRYLPGYVRGDITLDVGFASNDAAWDQFCHALEEQHLGIYTTTLLDDHTPAKQGDQQELSSCSQPSSATTVYESLPPSINCHESKNIANSMNPTVKAGRAATGEATAATNLGSNQTMLGAQTSSVVIDPIRNENASDQPRLKTPPKPQASPTLKSPPIDPIQPLHKFGDDQLDQHVGGCRKASQVENECQSPMENATLANDSAVASHAKNHRSPLTNATSAALSSTKQEDHRPTANPLNSAPYNSSSMPCSGRTNFAATNCWQRPNLSASAATTFPTSRSNPGKEHPSESPSHSSLAQNISKPVGSPNSRFRRPTNTGYRYASASHASEHREMLNLLDSPSSRLKRPPTTGTDEHRHEAPHCRFATREAPKSVDTTNTVRPNATASGSDFLPLSKKPQPAVPCGGSTESTIPHAQGSVRINVSQPHATHNRFAVPTVEGNDDGDPTIYPSRCIYAGRNGSIRRIVKAKVPTLTKGKKPEMPPPEVEDVGLAATATKGENLNRRIVKAKRPAPRDLNMTVSPPIGA
jgi:hypothetical protein